MLVAFVLLFLMAAFIGKNGLKTANVCKYSGGLKMFCTKKFALNIVIVFYFVVAFALHLLILNYFAAFRCIYFYFLTKKKLRTI